MRAAVIDVSGGPNNWPCASRTVHLRYHICDTKPRRSQPALRLILHGKHVFDIHVLVVVAPPKTGGVHPGDSQLFWFSVTAGNFSDDCKRTLDDLGLVLECALILQVVHI